MSYKPANRNHRQNWRFTPALLAILLGTLSGCQTQSSGPAANNANPSVQLPAAVAPADPGYAALPDYKAQAISHRIAPDSANGSETELEFSTQVSGTANALAAAIGALTECEAARAARSFATSACELRRRGNTVVHSTAELTAGLQPSRPAFLWQVTTSASGKVVTSYLAGSIHVLKPTIVAPPSYQQAFSQADTLVLEVDQAASPPAELAAIMQRYGNLQGDQRLQDLMTAADYKNVLAYSTSLGVPSESIERVKPAMALLQAGVFEYVSMGYLPQHGLEAVFERQLGDRKKLALETMELQLQAVTALPLPLQTELLLETVNEIYAARIEISQLVHAWLAGDEPALDRLFNDNAEASDATRQWMDDLLIKRNIGMAAGITDLLNDGRSHFVLVGAAHLVGEQSVIDLLRKHGFTPERIRYDTLEVVAVKPTSAISQPPSSQQ